MCSQGARVFLDMLGKLNSEGEIQIGELQDIHKRWLALQGLVRGSSLRTLEKALVSKLLSLGATITSQGAPESLTQEQITTVDFIADALLSFENTPEFARTQSMQSTCMDTTQKWREQQKQVALQKMSEGDPSLYSKALVETLDALRSSALDRHVLEALVRQLQQALKEVAQNPNAEKDAGSQLLTNISAVQEALQATVSGGESREDFKRIDYTFIAKLFANGLALRIGHSTWKSSNTKTALLSFIKAHNQTSELTISNEMHKTSCFYKDLAGELVKGNANALKELAAEKKKRAQDAGSLLHTLTTEAKQYAYGLRNGQSWKQGIEDSATITDVLALAHTKGQLLSGPGSKVTSAKGMLEDVQALPLLLCAAFKSHTREVLMSHVLLIGLLIGPQPGTDYILHRILRQFEASQNLATDTMIAKHVFYFINLGKLWLLGLAYRSISDNCACSC